MENYEAINILKALACCSSNELHCDECPMWSEKSECMSWTDEDVVEAVRTLNKK
jgi:hypothetical protein